MIARWEKLRVKVVVQIFLMILSLK
jgi:hypothetical protein